MLFNRLVGNRDDRLRNHGFIREPSGWRLSPAFDVNPNTAKQTHALAIDSHDAEPDVDVAMAQAELYRVSRHEAKHVLAEATAAIAGGRDEAARLKLPSAEIQRMETIIQA